MTNLVFQLEFEGIEIIERKAGGLGHDNDFGSFGDHYHTLRMFISLLEERGCLGPYVIQSSRMTRDKSTTGNHFQAIATRYEEFYNESSFAIQDNLSVTCLVCNEHDYIMSLEYVKEWIIKDLNIEQGYDDYFMVIDTITRKAIITHAYLTFNT